LMISLVVLINSEKLELSKYLSFLNPFYE
jgi:hypothetical protein